MSAAMIPMLIPPPPPLSSSMLGLGVLPALVVGTVPVVLLSPSLSVARVAGLPAALPVLLSPDASVVVTVVVASAAGPDTWPAAEVVSAASGPGGVLDMLPGPVADDGAVDAGCCPVPVPAVSAAARVVAVVTGGGEVVVGSSLKNMSATCELRSLAASWQGAAADGPILPRLNGSLS